MSGGNLDDGEGRGGLRPLPLGLAAGRPAGPHGGAGVGPGVGPGGRPTIGGMARGARGFATCIGLGFTARRAALARAGVDTDGLAVRPPVDFWPGGADDPHPLDRVRTGDPAYDRLVNQRRAAAAASGRGSGDGPDRIGRGLPASIHRRGRTIAGPRTAPGAGGMRPGEIRPAPNEATRLAPSSSVPSAVPAPVARSAAPSSVRGRATSGARPRASSGHPHGGRSTPSNPNGASGRDGTSGRDGRSGGGRATADDPGGADADLAAIRAAIAARRQQTGAQPGRAPSSSSSPSAPESAGAGARAEAARRGPRPPGAEQPTPGGGDGSRGTVEGPDTGAGGAGGSAHPTPSPSSSSSGSARRSVGSDGTRPPDQGPTVRVSVDGGTSRSTAAAAAADGLAVRPGAVPLPLASGNGRAPAATAPAATAPAGLAARSGATSVPAVASRDALPPTAATGADRPASSVSRSSPAGATPADASPAPPRRPADGRPRAGADDDRSATGRSGPPASTRQDGRPPGTPASGLSPAADLPGTDRPAPAFTDRHANRPSAMAGPDGVEVAGEKSGAPGDGPGASASTAADPPPSPVAPIGAPAAGSDTGADPRSAADGLPVRFAGLVAVHAEPEPGAGSTPLSIAGPADPQPTQRAGGQPSAPTAAGDRTAQPRGAAVGAVGATRAGGGPRGRDAASAVGGQVEAGGDPGYRFLTALESGRPDRPMPLPGHARPLARALAGEASVRVVTGAATRRALGVVGSAAATIGRTIYLAEAPGTTPTQRGILAHELVHAARPSPLPRFFADPRPSAEERLAHETGHRVAAGLPLPAAPIGAGLPLATAQLGLVKLSRAATSMAAGRSTVGALGPSLPLAVAPPGAGRPTVASSPQTLRTGDSQSPWIDRAPGSIGSPRPGPSARSTGPSISAPMHSAAAPDGAAVPVASSAARVGASRGARWIGAALVRRTQDHGGGPSRLPAAASGLRRAAMSLGSSTAWASGDVDTGAPGPVRAGFTAPGARPPSAALAAGAGSAGTAAGTLDLRRSAAPFGGTSGGGTVEPMARISRPGSNRGRETFGIRGLRDAERTGGAGSGAGSTRSGAFGPGAVGPHGSRPGTAGLPVGGLSNIVGPGRPEAAAGPAGDIARRHATRRKDAPRRSGDPTPGALAAAGGGGSPTATTAPPRAAVTPAGSGQTLDLTGGGGGTPPPAGPSGGGDNGNGNNGGPAAATATAESAPPPPTTSAFDDFDRLVELLEERLLAELERRGARFRGGPF